MIFIPIIRNKVQFQRVKASKIECRKKHCIDLILCFLRHLIYRQLSRSSNCTVFLIFGITLLSSCTSVRSIPCHEGVHALSSTKQKQKIVFLQKKLESAEKSLHKAQEEVEELRSELCATQLCLIEKQLSLYEAELQKTEVVVPEKVATRSPKALLMKERETLQEILEEGSSSQAFIAQSMLDRILRTITMTQADKN